MSLHLNKVLLTLVVRLPEHVFERHLPASPVVVGEALAEQIQRQVQAQHLGYYPALEFFKEAGGVEQALLDAADNIAWFVCNAARDEVQRKLRPVFSSLSFQSVQAQVYTLPAVRPNQPNAYRKLVEHYTPDSVKLVLVVSSFQKSEMPEAITKWASHLAYRWLKESFASIEVTSAQAV